MKKQNPKRDWLDRIRFEVREYCKAHPACPAARRHPHVVVDQGRYVALLGKSPGTDILGFGTSVASALRSFNELYPDQE